MYDHLIILGIILGALVLFALEIVRSDLVAIGVALALMLGGSSRSLRASRASATPP